jgi:hypothetical protein
VSDGPGKSNLRNAAHSDVKELCEQAKVEKQFWLNCETAEIENF